jgi:UDP:flavonoid glycosyltransferase YjiC (YdhE family)
VSAAVSPATPVPTEPRLAQRHAIFAAIPAWGHLRPLVVQAATLVRRGWRATVLSADGMRPHVERRFAGVDFMGVGGTPGGERRAREVHARASAESDFVRSTALMSDWALEFWPLLFDGVRAALRARPTDVAVVDLASLGALDAAEAEGVPALVNDADLVTFLSTDIVPPMDALPPPLSGRPVREVRLRDRLLSVALRHVSPTAVRLTQGRRINALRRARGLSPLDINERLNDRVVLVNSCFGPEYPRPLPPTVQMVGPMIDKDDVALTDEDLRWLDAGGPCVYVSLGTLARPAADLLARVAGGIAKSGLRVLWAVRDDGAEGLRARLPPTARVVPWVSSSLGVLAHPNVRVFLSHCGINSAYEAIVAGTPVVGLPLFVDQRDMARRLADVGVAVVLDKTTATADDVARALRRVVADDGYRRALPALQSCVRLAGGSARAADLIEHVASHGAAHLMAPTQRGGSL